MSIPVAVFVHPKVAQAPTPVLLAVRWQSKFPSAPPLLVCVFLHSRDDKDLCGALKDSKEAWNMLSRVQLLTKHGMVLT